jgi:hypothetical protein
MKPTTLSLRSVVGMVENLGIGIGITGQPFFVVYDIHA